MTYILTADGGSRGNPGPSAYGFATWQTPNQTLDKNQILDIIAHTAPIFKTGKYVGHTTNNQVEWGGLIAGLEHLAKAATDQSDLKNIYVALDSELVVKQITGVYKVKNPGLQILFTQAKLVLEIFKAKKIAVEFMHIYREFNQVADAEVNQVLDNLLH